MTKMKPFIDETDEGFRVGARYADGVLGSVAEVFASSNTIGSRDATWIKIVADDYEGVAMLHIEALPHLRRALGKIAAELKASGNKVRVAPRR